MGFFEEILALLGSCAPFYRTHIDIMVCLAARLCKTGRKNSSLKRKGSNITFIKLEPPVSGPLAVAR